MYRASNCGKLPPPRRRDRILGLCAPDEAPELESELAKCRLGTRTHGRAGSLRDGGDLSASPAAAASPDLAGRALDDDVAVSSKTTAGPLPPVTPHELLEKILTGADVVGRAGTWIGLFEFMAFAALRKRRVILELEEVN